MIILILEDQVHSAELLKLELIKSDFKIDEICIAQTIEESVDIIKKKNPSLVFLDIHLKHELGLDLFVHFDKPTFQTIFTTAYDKYAVQAFRLAATDYLLKPIDTEELHEALRKFYAKEIKPVKVDNLRKGILQEDKIFISTNKGFEIIEINNIVRLVAEGSYTSIETVSGEKYFASKPLKHFETCLPDFKFIRINRAELVRVNSIKKFFRGRYPQLELQNGLVVQVSDRKRKFVLNLFRTAAGTAV